MTAPIEPPRFFVGPPITQPSRFFGRERELTRIFNLLKHLPLQNAAIVGPRRSGKTSLLHHLRTITTTPRLAASRASRTDRARERRLSLSGRTRAPLVRAGGDVMHPRSTFQDAESPARRTLFRLLGVPWTANTKSLHFPVTRSVFGIVVAFVFMGNEEPLARVAYGIVFGLILMLT